MAGDREWWMNVEAFRHIPSRCGLRSGPATRDCPNSLPGWELPGRPWPVLVPGWHPRVWPGPKTRTRRGLSTPVLVCTTHVSHAPTNTCIQQFSTLCVQTMRVLQGGELAILYEALRITVSAWMGDQITEKEKNNNNNNTRRIKPLIN